MLIYILELLLLVVVIFIVARLVFFFQKQHQQNSVVKKEPILSVDLEKTNSNEQQHEIDEDSCEVGNLLQLDENQLDDLSNPSDLGENLGVASNTLENPKLEKKFHKSVLNSQKKVNKTSPTKEIISLTILAKKEQPYAGYEFLQALLSAGFRYGEMNIFHRHENIDGTGKVLFSLAQAVQPGTFDINDVGALSCPGIIMFMESEGQEDALATLNIMIDTAKLLIEELGGVIYDEERKPMTPGSLARIRSRVLIQMRKKSF